MSDQLPPPPKGDEGPWVLEFQEVGKDPVIEDEPVVAYRLDGDVMTVKFEGGTLIYFHLSRYLVALTPKK